ncbi:thermonuclease family protein [Parasedimentitalea marina]|uniref:Thermonuclease family protein n=1 Tax=Parasedimentitalea marina TaxID=2483033 RepID=A0A3T0MZY3_9RHOB|nr:thermonuclease family protein [Parasedimentitalea marina]AZV77317.1 thermonuclease family protein [Parasedimentitalea marina]
MIIKRTLAAATLVTLANTVSSAELPSGDPISARIFLELHSIQKLSADIRPLVSAPGEAFRVIDGDFLALGNLRIRLVGIDAPDSAQRCNTPDGSSWDCSAQSSDRARDVIHMAERVECFTSENGNHGLYVASCQADGSDVGALLVGEGLAWPEQDEGYYLAESNVAQTEGLGIWQAYTQPPWEWRIEQN